MPSQTELLADLGLDEEVVGITKFCVHPEGWLKRKTIVGGTKTFRFETIDALKPDLIIGNKEENYREGIEKLLEKYRVWISDIATFDDAIGMIRAVGELTERSDRAEQVIDSIRQSFSQLRKVGSFSVLYLIWRNPWMAAGTGTFINTMLAQLGLRNAVTTPRYPEMSVGQLKNIHPDYVFLSSEPYPFSEKHVQEIREIFPAAKVLLVDGEMFSWFGSRLIQSPAYFNSLRLE